MNLQPKSMTHVQSNPQSQLEKLLVAEVNTRASCAAVSKSTHYSQSPSMLNVLEQMLTLMHIFTRKRNDKRDSFIACVANPKASKHEPIQSRVSVFNASAT